jgi:hypothetical protein
VIGMLHDLVIEPTERRLVGRDEGIEPLHVRLSQTTNSQDLSFHLLAVLEVNAERTSLAPGRVSLAKFWSTLVTKINCRCAIYSPTHTPRSACEEEPGERQSSLC